MDAEEALKNLLRRVLTFQSARYLDDRYLGQHLEHRLTKIVARTLAEILADTLALPVPGPTFLPSLVLQDLTTLAHLCPLCPQEVERNTK